MRLAGFDVVATIGSGGSSIVYSARAPDGDEIAIKVATGELTERERASFLDEAELLRTVSHEALVPLREAGVLPDGRPYLCMPLLRGETLGARLARGPLPPADAVRLVSAVGGALSALHARGLAHRDVKPENVMLVDDGARAILLDVGIARRLDSGPSTTTAAGKVRGTLAYMAPERLFGQPATVRSDVYELAVLLFVALTGELPWEKEDAPEDRLVPRDPCALRPEIERRLGDSLLRALATRVETRPASVEELVADWQSPAPVAAPRATSLLPALVPEPPRANTATALVKATPLPRPAPRWTVLALGASIAAAFVGWRASTNPPEAALANHAAVRPTTTAAGLSDDGGEGERGDGALELAPLEVQVEARAIASAPRAAPPRAAPVAGSAPAPASASAFGSASAVPAAAPALALRSTAPSASEAESLPECAKLLASICKDNPTTEADRARCSELRQDMRRKIRQSWEDPAHEASPAAEREERRRFGVNRWCRGLQRFVR